MVKLYLLSVFLIVCHSNVFCQNIGEINDAVFSPDGETIAVGGTKGVYLYRFEDMSLTDVVEMDDDVHFIRWSPDSTKFVAAHWDDGDEQSEAAYASVDVRTGDRLFEIDDSIRWSGRLFRYDNDSEIETFDRPVKNAAHPNTLVYSPNGERFGYVDENNQIVLRDASTGTIIETVNSMEQPVIPPENVIASIGFTSDEEMYAGTFNGRCFSIQEGRVEEKLNGVITSVFQPFLISSNWNVVLALSEIFITHSSMASDYIIQYFCIYSKNGSRYERKSQSSLYSHNYAGPTRPMQRVKFINNQSNIVLLNHLGSTLFDTINDVFVKDVISVSFFSIDGELISRSGIQKEFSISSDSKDYFVILLLQPFSPNGDYFLLLENGTLYLYETGDLPHKILLPIETKIEGFTVWN